MSVSVPVGDIKGKVLRSSNLELYRIICMIMIVAYHYLVNSGLYSSDGPIITSSTSVNTLFLLVFGAWGKVGINCFLLITGYFMCTSNITLRKFIKLIMQIYFYKISIFIIFVIAGYDSVSITRVVAILMPVWGFSPNDFVSCFIAFWLTIPFLNILVRHLTKRQHEMLILLSLFLFSVLGTLPLFVIPINYITWFGIIYFIASYIRLYPHPLFERKKIWALSTIIIYVLIVMSIIGIQCLFGSRALYFISECNRILAVLFAVCSFLWFKNIDIRYNKVINSFGAGTFGVLLIHANSNAMRSWLWKDIVDCVGHYSLSLGNLILYSFGVVLAIFIVCNLIDQLRINTLEKWFFQWYDNKYAVKAEAFVSRIVNGKKH